MNLCNFFLEQVFLVQKQHYGSGGKVLVVTDAVEEVETFMQSVLLKWG